MTVETQVALDEAKVEAFGERLMDAFNAGAMVLMTSVGHRTGLFDAMDGGEPGTSAEIAAAAGLQERYVREWLGAMTTSRIVDYDPETKTYRLPPEHAALLTRKSVPNNMASIAQWLAVLGSVETEIVDKFVNGGGVHYCQYDRFHDVMAEESAQTTVSALLDEILPLVPGLRERLEAGIEVLDVGCGAGRAMVFLAEHFPDSRFRGYDLSEEATAAGNAQAAEKGLTNVVLEARDVSRMDDVDRFDLITAFDAIHDQADPAGVLGNIRRALKADGTFLMQDIHASSHVEKNLDHPLGTFTYTISCMHCMTVSLAMDGAGLGAAWGRELAEQMLDEAGFTGVEVHRLEHDVLNDYYVCR